MTTLRRILAVPAGRISLFVLVLVALLVVFGGTIAPHDPLAQNTDMMLQGPSSAHLLGTDYLGRDVLSRLIAGSRISVLGALEAVGVALLLGVGPGMASAWFGRRLEWLALRITDTLMVLPFTVFAIAVVGTLGNGLHQSMIAIGILMTPLYFRVTRAATLGLKQAQYVEAAELMGASQWFVLRRHIWSKVLPTVAVTTAQAIGTALLVMASLTFLGLGVTPPDPSWGGMLGSDLAYLTQQAWAPLIPGAMIMVTVGSLNLLADVIRDNGPDSVRRGWRAAWRGNASAVVGVVPVAASAPPTVKEGRDVSAPAA
jgi:peptide/nickel transport system permease protein